MTKTQDETGWLRDVSRRRTAEIRAEHERRAATVEQQQAAARHIVDAIGILAASDARIARAVARQIELGLADAVPEFLDPADPLTCVYRVVVQMPDGEPLTLVRVPWHAFGLTVDQVRAEHAAAKAV